MACLPRCPRCPRCPSQDGGHLDGPPHLQQGGETVPPPSPPPPQIPPGGGQLPLHLRMVVSSLRCRRVVSLRRLLRHRQGAILVTGRLRRTRASSLPSLRGRGGLGCPLTPALIPVDQDGTVIHLRYSYPQCHGGGGAHSLYLPYQGPGWRGQ